jgi:hypothetical protein
MSDTATVVAEAAASVATITVNVYNNAQYPLRNLVIAHHQDNTSSEVNTTQEYRGIARGQKLSFEQKFDPDKHDFWVVAWENLHDLAVYYLVSKSNWLHKIEEALKKEMEDALEDALEDAVAAAAPAAGNAAATAANLLVQDILMKRDTHAMLEHRIEYHYPWHMDIVLDCDRLHGELISFKETTSTPKEYKDTYNISCHAKCRA